MNVRNVRPVIYNIDSIVNVGERVVAPFRENVDDITTYGVRIRSRNKNIRITPDTGQLLYDHVQPTDRIFSFPEIIHNYPRDTISRVSLHTRLCSSLQFLYVRFDNNDAVECKMAGTRVAQSFWTCLDIFLSNASVSCVEICTQLIFLLIFTKEYS